MTALPTIKVKENVWKMININRECHETMSDTIERVFKIYESMNNKPKSLSEIGLEV